MTSICVVIPAWERFELTELVLKSYHHTALNLAKSNTCRLVVLLASDQEEYVDIARRWSAHLKVVENRPLGRKFNKAMEAGALLGDYVMLTGSDDLISEEYFRAIIRHLEGPHPEPWGGVSSLVFCNIEPSAPGFELVKVRQEIGVLGTGLWMRSDLMLKVKKRYGGLYMDFKNQGIDVTAGPRLKEVSKYSGFNLSSPEPLVLGIKSGINIWSFDKFRRFPACDIKSLTAFRSEDLEAIKTLKIGV